MHSDRIDAHIDSHKQSRRTTIGGFFLSEESTALLDKLDKVDLAVAGGGVTAPLWVPGIAPWLQWLMFILGAIYLLMRMYREYLLIVRERRSLALPITKPATEEDGKC